MEFNLKKFIEQPTVQVFADCTIEQMLSVAEHFNIDIRRRIHEKHFKGELLTKLFMLDIFPEVNDTERLKEKENEAALKRKHDEQIRKEKELILEQFEIKKRNLMIKHQALLKEQELEQQRLQAALDEIKRLQEQEDLERLRRLTIQHACHPVVTAPVLCTQAALACPNFDASSVSMRVPLTPQQKGAPQEHLPEEEDEINLSKNSLMNCEAKPIPVEEVKLLLHLQEVDDDLGDCFLQMFDTEHETKPDTELKTEQTIVQSDEDIIDLEELKEDDFELRECFLFSSEEEDVPVSLREMKPHVTHSPAPLCPVSATTEIKEKVVVDDMGPSPQPKARDGSEENTFSLSVRNEVLQPYIGHVSNDSESNCLYSAYSVAGNSAVAADMVELPRAENDSFPLAVMKSIHSPTGILGHDVDVGLVSVNKNKSYRVSLDKRCLFGFRTF